MIPKLRFSEFTESWNEVSIGDIATISRGRFSPRPRNDPRYYGGDTEFIQTSEVVGANPNILNGSKSLNKEGVKVSKVFPSGTIVMTIAANIGYVGFANRPVAFPDSLVGISAFEDILPKYIYYSLSRKQRRLDYIAEEAAQKNITSPTVRKFKIWHTRNQQEQVTLTNFFDLINLKINLLTKKKEALETYKKGLLQKIFSQELRFKGEDGIDYPDWENFKLSDILIEHKKRSDGSEQVHSVSVHKGVINQIEHLGRSFAAKDVSNYNKVLFGDIIYTKSPTGDFPYGIIKQSYVKSAIVSPLYCVTSPIDINIGYLLKWFFESKINVHNYLHPIIQKGAKNTINITNTTFLSRSLSLPSDKAERQKIKDIYSSLNENLRTLESEISKVTEFKKGLLQQMFV